MELFKFIFILSMTYYHVSKNNTKIFLFSYIKDSPEYQKSSFWEDYLNELIGHDLKGSLISNDLEKLNKDEKEKLINCYFSNFLTAVKAMADFRLEKKFVRDFVEKNKDKYNLSKDQIDNICMIYDISLNDNETIYNGDFLENELNNKTNKENEKSKDNTNPKIKENKESIEKKENTIDKQNKDKNENKEAISNDNKDNSQKKEIENKDEKKNTEKKEKEKKKNEIQENIEQKNQHIGEIKNENTHNNENKKENQNNDGNVEKISEEKSE